MPTLFFRYSTTHTWIKGPLRDLDLSSFTRSEGWYAFIEEIGLAPAEAQEVIRAAMENDGNLHDVTVVPESNENDRDFFCVVPKRKSSSLAFFLVVSPLPRPLLQR